MSILPPVTQPRFRFRRGALEPPGLYVTADDQLVFRVETDSTFAGTVEARVRVLSPRLVPEDYRLQLVIAVGGATSYTTTANLIEGFLQGVNCSILGDFTDPAPETTFPGRVYGHVGVGKGLGSGGYEHTVLAAGYITARTTVGWPGGVAQGFGDGLGHVQFLPLTQPAAGADFRYQVAGYYRELVAWSAVLTTDATVGNRGVGVGVQAGTSWAYRTQSTLDQAPSSTVRYSFGAGGQAYTHTISPRIESNVSWPVKLIMPPQTYFASSTVGLGPGDQWSSILIVCRDWAA